MPALITTDLVALDADLGADKSAVVRRLAELVADAGRATGADGLHADAMAREAQAATGLPGGIAIPHCRSAAVTEASLGVRPAVPEGRLRRPGRPRPTWCSSSPPRTHGDADHLTLLTALARALVRPEFVASLRVGDARPRRSSAWSRTSSPPRPAAAGRRAPPRPPRRGRRPAAQRSIVAVTACPTGIAHTYMAADKLSRRRPRRPASTLHVETQGSSGATPLDPAVIRAADAVIFAVDVGVRGPGPVRRQAGRRSPAKRASTSPT